ncbi:hypothetical protein QR77_33925 [Streptomyces sp. 150FB]|nr:hypothetical protein QR77_33925 [Streptomyces sp. 150FB]
MMLPASAGGNRGPVIAQLVQADEDTVRDAIHRFNEIGPARLDPRWAGGPSTLTAEPGLVAARPAQTLIGDTNYVRRGIEHEPADHCGRSSSRSTNPSKVNSISNTTERASGGVATRRNPAIRYVIHLSRSEPTTAMSGLPGSVGPMSVGRTRLSAACRCGLARFQRSRRVPTRQACDT